MSQRQLNHFPNLRHLFATAADVIVADVVQLFFVLTLHRFALAVHHRVGCHNAVRRGVGFDHLELHRVHGAAHQKQVPLLHRSVGLQKVRLEVHIEEIAGDALDGVVQRQNMHALTVWHVAARSHRHHVRQTHAEILADRLVHAHVGVVARLVGEHDAHSVLSLLSLDKDGVTAKQLELLHLGGREGDHRVVVVRHVVHDQSVGGPLFSGTEDGVFHVFVFDHFLKCIH